MTEAVEAVQIEATSRRIRVEPQVSQPDIELDIDADRIRIVLVNLLVNAIKYSPEQSTVTISAQHGAGEVTVAVSDQGPGIDPAVADSLFEAWRRGPEVDAAGLGLGLYIARKLIELHRGRLNLRSKPDNGSTFTMTLPR